MSDIIDIDCGSIITGEKTIEEMGEEILDYCIETASGSIISKAVQIQNDDFIPWKRGVYVRTMMNISLKIISTNLKNW